jgi:flavin reductase (DIM6/NTAB) family NADH-FMN oxidoreductase RutF
VAASSAPAGPIPPGADAHDYDRMRRRILWMLPSGLYLLGSRGADGRQRNLMTLSWATQVAVDPKLVAVSVEIAALSHRLVHDGGCFALSVLSREDRTVVRRFVKPAVADEEGRLNGYEVLAGPTGAPILAQASAWIDCELRQALPCGSHTLFIGQVVDCGVAQSEAAVLRMEDTRMSYGG